MKICNNKKAIYNLVQAKAKYQKVLLIYDNSISEFEINLVYNEIKQICVFNKMHINKINEQEFYNGYKVLIFLCSGESIINFKFNREEFINIYYPTDNVILPFFVNNNKILNKNCFLLILNNNFDINILNSLNFNVFFNYLQNLLNNFKINYDLHLFNYEINNLSLYENLNKLNNNFSFIDIELIKECGLNYEDLWLVDLILINAFITLITAIKSKQLALVDVYKSARENYALIDKFYAFANNNYFKNIITLNYNYILKFALQTKENILKNEFNFILDEVKVNKIINKIKNYAKNCNNLLIYLYIYNIFSD